MFASRLQVIRQKHGFALIAGAAQATGITEKQWEAMEAGASPEETLGRDEALAWIRRLAKITGDHPVLMDEASFPQMRAESARGRDRPRFRNSVESPARGRGKLPL